MCSRAESGQDARAHPQYARPGEQATRVRVRTPSGEGWEEPGRRAGEDGSASDGQEGHERALPGGSRAARRPGAASTAGGSGRSGRWAPSPRRRSRTARWRCSSAAAVATSRCSTASSARTWPTAPPAATSSPRRRPDVILAVTRAVDRGSGVLYLYGNYAGDIMNFDIGRRARRRRGHPGADGARLGRRRLGPGRPAGPPARDRRRHLRHQDRRRGGHRARRTSTRWRASPRRRATPPARSASRVAAGSIPETGERTFELGDDEIEIGMGAPRRARRPRARRWRPPTRSST